MQSAEVIAAKAAEVMMKGSFDENKTTNPSVHCCLRRFACAAKCLCGSKRDTAGKVQLI